ncbi:MAG: tetratricopeptide repeat protein [Catenulispora sp.]|nr:tetratricopeptide repeat protein [Catenulispora sp.]
MSRHLHVVGIRARDRRPILEQSAGAVFAGCHQGLRGPYTGVDTVLRAILPDARRRWPELVDYHRMEVLEAIPELSELIGPAPHTLAKDAPFEERTRWYGNTMTLCFSHGIITLMREYARRLREAGSVPPPLVFDDVHNAEITTQEFLALFVRRVGADVWPVAIGTDGEVEPVLATALAEYAEQVQAPALPEPEPRPAAELVAEYLELDGTSDDPAAHAAYLALDPEERAALHDRRADEIESEASWGVRISALAYHREHGSDPHGAGVKAVQAAAEYLTVMGFQPAALKMSERGRALTDPDREPEIYRRFTNMLISHVLGLGQLEEAIELCGEVRRRYTQPKAHMLTSYFMAMIYTRFAVPRDHLKALEYQNNAVALANSLPDERERLIYSGFEDNALALIEMHRGNLTRALHLVEGAMQRADGLLGPQDWVVHRSQLLYNRARLLAALGRQDEAYELFTKLSEMDPYYTDYFTERAKISRARGDLEAAIRDYDIAAELGPPFVELYHNRGSAYAELGRTEEALADFTYVLDMHPIDADTLLSRAELLFDVGDLDGAAADIDRALELVDGDPRLLCLRGMIHLAADEADLALSCLDAALGKDPDYPAALINRAYALFELSEPGRAAQDLTRALELSDTDPDLLLNRGIAYAACDDTASALADFDLALTLPNADRPELLFQRGRCLIGAGDPDRAEADLRECRRLGSRAAEIDELLTSV